MTREEFIDKLKTLNLSKKDFSDITTVPYSTVNNWGTVKNNKKLAVPCWVEPFLNHYIKSQKFDYIAQSICGDLKGF